MEGSSDHDDYRTVSEGEETHHSTDSDESGSESSEGGNLLLDLEAVESGDDDRDEDDESDDGFGAESHDEAYHRTFHQFGRLPPELRQRVWEFFDPELRAPARVFSLLLVGKKNLWPAANTARQTAPARAVLAVHRESRQIALKFYPDTFHLIDRGSVCRFHSIRDVIVLSPTSPFNDWGRVGVTDSTTIENLEHVKNLGFEIEADLQFKSVLQRFPFRVIPGLERIYHCRDANRIRARDIRWCLRDTVHAFEIVTEEESPGLGENYRQLFCWPDLERHRDYAEAEIPPLLPPDVTDVCPKGLEVWPMLVFNSDRGAQRYITLKVRSDDVPDVEWPSDLSDDSWGVESDWSHPGEYESDGIDDGTIDGSDDVDEDDDDGDLLVDGSSADGHDIGDEDDEGPDFEGFSPSQGDPVAVPSDGLSPARFSSLEAESRDGVSEDADGSGSDQEPAAPANRRARRQVIHSDSEDDHTLDESPKKEEKQAPRQANRRGGRVVLSDSDDEDESEDEDGGANVNAPSGSSRSARRGNRVVSEDDDDDDSNQESEEKSDEEPDEDDWHNKPMSLAERLQLYRSENPVPADGAGSSDDEDDNSNHNGNDGAGSDGFYRTAEDDDDDGLVNGEAAFNDDDISENDLIMDMAEEDEYEEDGQEW